ncbi:type II secretion system major pseudopilin GspG [Opitutus sp. ER46]|uniref:type II secretion system major pseudopilin GspG n=1 Tax=Opitutus sp. ER46 TaxID=2161864 RepID=UPI000D31EC93|nr:type II secretion system major pseudopilin GspG [Opitutus sp. ER46]PTX91639.1 type II secretion system protein GspG [Opitutus sp. ER46]
MQFSKAKRTKRNRGFTMLEIMVVLAIIGLLTGLGISQVNKMLDNARVDTATLFVNTSVKVPLMSYRMHMGDYPSTQEGLQALLTPPSSRAGMWRGPYVERMSLDPWGEPYQYAAPGTHNKDGYDVWSKGPDKQSGTEDDIGNWERSAPKQ